MNFFKTKRLNGVDYTLHHLDPFQFPLAANGTTFNIEVEFACHCFTEDVGAHHRPDVIYVHDGERRAFDLDRYERSKFLPNLITTLGTRSVYYTQQVNYFFLRNLPDVPDDAGPYVVFFNPERATRKAGVDVRLIIQSAYCKPNMVDQAAPVKFTTLVEATAKARRVNRGPMQQIKRK